MKKIDKLVRKLAIEKLADNKINDCSEYWQMMWDQYECGCKEEGKKTSDAGYSRYVKLCEDGNDEWWLLNYIDDPATRDDAIHIIETDRAKRELARELKKHQKKITLKINGKKVFSQKCNEIKIGTLGGAIECEQKGEGCKNCLNCRGPNDIEFSYYLAQVAHDWGWFGSGNYQLFVEGGFEGYNKGKKFVEIVQSL